MGNFTTSESDFCRFMAEQQKHNIEIQKHKHFLSGPAETNNSFTSEDISQKLIA